MMNRRSFLSRSLLGAASFGVGTALPLGRNRRFELFRSAEAAELPTPYPVLAIMLGGGLDPAMHMVATPNGSIGKATVVNRQQGESSFRTTRTGIRYVSTAVTPTGKTDFEPHLNDVALIRALNAYGDHSALAALWFGDEIMSKSGRFGKLPWASQLAAQFRQRGVIVQKPCAISYGYDPVTPLYMDYVKWGTESPDPATVADRIRSLDGYFKAISPPANLPPPARQAPTYTLIDALDRGLPSATQEDYAQRFAAANGTASEVLRNLSGGQPAWPPPPGVISALGISAADLTKPLERLRPEHMFALAFQALNHNKAHVITFPVGGGWDSHVDNVGNQIVAGNRLWPALGKLLALMKATPSPIDPTKTKTLFDTTNIWIQSEMGRGAGAFFDIKTKMLTSGTEHWRHGSAMFIGGRFKRGAALGGFTPDWTSKPVNPATGSEAGGIVLRTNNAIATVMKAAGGDPSQFTDAAPIDALLDMSR